MFYKYLPFFHPICVSLWKPLFFHTYHHR